MVLPVLVSAHTFSEPVVGYLEQNGAAGFDITSFVVKTMKDYSEFATYASYLGVKG
jgi:hypothetical protein